MHEFALNSGGLDYAPICSDLRWPGWPKSTTKSAMTSGGLHYAPICSDLRWPGWSTSTAIYELMGFIFTNRFLKL